MSNRYVQVMRTYTRSWPVWLSALPVAILCVSAMVMPPRDRDVRLFGSWFTSFIFGWCALALTAHLKAQIADWRSSLMPRFRLPHIVVGIAVMTMLAGALPWMLSRPMGVAPMALTGIIALSSGLLSWIGFRQTIGTAAVCILFAGLMMIPGVQPKIQAMLAGNAPGVSAIVLGTAGLVFAALWARMALLHEEMTEYAQPDVGNAWKLRALMTGDPALATNAAAEAHWLNSLIHGQYRGGAKSIWNAGLLRRAWHWRVVIGNEWASWIVAIMLSGSLLGIPIVLHKITPRDGATLRIGFVMMITLGAIPMLWISWLRRWPTLGYESVRPVSRKRLLIEMGTAMIWEAASAVFAIVICGLIPVLIWMPPGQIRPLLAILPVPAAAVLATTAIGLWVLRLRSVWVSCVLLTVLTIVAHLPLFFMYKLAGFPMGQPMNGRIALSECAVVLILIGVAAFVLRDAYLRWQATDLD